MQNLLLRYYEKILLPMSASFRGDYHVIWGDDVVFKLPSILKPDWLYFWKPKWLYEAMPMIYYLSGVTAIIYFESPSGRGAGVVLMLTAGLIWVMRIQNRKRK